MCESSLSTQFGADPPGQDWQEIEVLLDEIAAASRGDLTAREFHSLFLDRLVRAVASIGAAIWVRDTAGHLRLDCHVNFDTPRLLTDESGARQHAILVAGIFETGQARQIPAGYGDDRTANPTGCLLYLHPLRVLDTNVAVVEVLQRPESQPEQLRGYDRIVSAACELATDFHRERRLRELARRESQWNDYREFCNELHNSLDLSTTAAAIANESRRLISCDRVSVAVRRGPRYRIAAVSGVDTVQGRSNTIRRLETLLRMAMRLPEPLYFPDADNPLPPELEPAVEAVVDATHARWLSLVPLSVSSTNNPDRQNQTPNGALVVEHFSAPDEAEMRGRIDIVRPQASRALSNAVALHRLPFSGVLRRLSGLTALARLEYLPRSLLVLATVIATVVAIVLIPGTLRITARGELQPRQRQRVFAPNDGRVDWLVTPSEEGVRKGDILAKLVNQQLDLELSEVTGRKDTVSEQVLAVRAARMSNDPAAVDARDSGQLSAQERQLDAELKSLNSQSEILQQQLEQLKILSPLDGEVLTWDFVRRLSARPVQRGDLLMTVADLDGPWELELRIDDADAGHVNQAYQASTDGLPVTFQIASQPGRQFSGRLTSLAEATDVDASGAAVVLATIELEEDSFAGLRPGASVVAKIDCGSRSIGFVWLRPVIEALQRHVFF